MSAEPGPPLTSAAILRMATTYLSRRAASTRQLRQYLLRKIRRRSTDEANRPDEQVLGTMLDDVLGKLGNAGYLDDAALARTRAVGLAAKGLPASRVGLKLRHQGLAVEPELLPQDEDAQARRFAERKRLGPFATGRREASIDRDVRAMVRAGFSPRTAFRVLRLSDRESGLDGSVLPADDMNNS